MLAPHLIRPEELDRRTNHSHKTATAFYLGNVGSHERQERMQRHLILHAGMHKTGTSSIQKYLHTADLQNAGYLKWRKPNHSILFVMLFAQKPQEHWFFRQRNVSLQELSVRRKRQRKKIAQQILSSRHSLFLFSAERMYGASRRDLENCRSFFSEHFPKISVHCYVRDPLGFAASMFQQNLKTGGVPGPLSVLPRFSQRIGNLDGVFGEDQVHLRLHRDPHQRSENIVEDFCDWVGLDSTTDKNIAANQSLSADATALLYLFRKRAGFQLTSADAVAENQKMIQALTLIDGPRLRFSDAFFGEDGREILAREQNWVQARMNRTLPEPGAQAGNVLAFDKIDDIEDYGRQVFHQRSGAEFRDEDWFNAPQGLARRFSQTVA